LAVPQGLIADRIGNAAALAERAFERLGGGFSFAVDRE
jgi:hypothetical protein